MTMMSVLLVGERKMELNTGLFVTLGGLTGEKVEISDLLEELTTLILREIALGECLLILGARMLEIRPNWLQKMKNLSLTLTLMKDQLARENPRRT